jgi:hypothetical protein
LLVELKPVAAPEVEAAPQGDRNRDLAFAGKGRLHYKKVRKMATEVKAEEQKLKSSRAGVRLGGTETA